MEITSQTGAAKKMRKSAGRDSFSTPLATVLCVLFTFICCTSSRAGKLEPEWKYQKNIINHSVTLKKVREMEEKVLTDSKKYLPELIKMTRQRVFWVGYVDEFIHEDGYSFLLLNIDGDRVWAVADDAVRNLDFERKGFKVGIKGTLVLKKNHTLDYLDGWSLILLRPPLDQEFMMLQERESLSTGFTFTTKKKCFAVESTLYPFIKLWITVHNPHYDEKFVEQLAQGIIYYCGTAGIDPRLALALFTVESAMDVDAISSSGAIGLGQLMPGTASGLGVDPYNTVENINGAVKYLSSLLKMWSGRSDRISLSLASYNAGPGNVTKYGGIPPFSETVNYVFFIKYLYQELCAQTKGLNPQCSIIEQTDSGSQSMLKNSR
ncbi:MAG: lytic transglycosylase domain-containing protein [Vulcanimicrobiota bacterium]